MNSESFLLTRFLCIGMHKCPIDRPLAKLKQKSSLFADTVVVNYDANIVIICNTFSISVRIIPEKYIKTKDFVHINPKFASAVQRLLLQTRMKHLHIRYLSN